jgi:hypothetical protein
MRVRELLYGEGFTIAGAKKRLREKGVEPRETDDKTELAHARMRHQLETLKIEVEAFLQELTDVT